MSRQFSCVTPKGKFVFGIHKPEYTVLNLRKSTNIVTLGPLDNETEFRNEANYPTEDIKVEKGTWVYEIPNPFPFRGATYISKSWADNSAADISRIQLPQQKNFSFLQFTRDQKIPADLIKTLPQPLQLAIATSSTDSADLIRLAEVSCEFAKDTKGDVVGLRYFKKGSSIKALIHDHDLFEAIANNPCLPDSYKEVMVLRPGAQGGSEIVGEWPNDENTHVYEYHRRNSYIAGGHFASNMADDAVRYSIRGLKIHDMHALRHLYYQRMYVCIADRLGVKSISRKYDSNKKLEELRFVLLNKLDHVGGENLSTLWGWNFGFDFTPTNYRLHASHQQIHQQYALIPEMVEHFSGDTDHNGETMASFCCGDMIANVIEDYSRLNQSDFFTDYCNAIYSNKRMDEKPKLESSLIVWEDNNVMLFVPKAQTSQWELQIMTKADTHDNFPGNILETNSATRESLNQAILTAQQIYEKLGAKMVTSIEFSKRINERQRFNQPLLYSLLPKIPYSMGAFSEAQLRFINGHYPEDFAAACRNKMTRYRKA